MTYLHFKALNQIITSKNKIFKAINKKQSIKIA